jgi:hypothetical protein
MQWPAAIGQGLEQRIRLGTFKELVKGGKSLDDAARIVKDTALDYNVPGIANRRFRDIVPFGAFITQNAKQQAGFIAKYPGVAVGAEHFFGEGHGDELKYPYMDEQLAIPNGLDEEGNPRYITSIGLPLEGLANIGTSYRSTVGNLQPLLKAAASSVTGIDPFTGGQYGTYEKIAGVEMGEAGRKLNMVASTGLLQPFTSLLQPITLAMDDRKSIPEKLMQATTYLRQTSVDPHRAERQRVEELLKDMPDVKQYKSYYKTDENPEVDELLGRLKDARAALKEKRAAAAAGL